MDRSALPADAGLGMFGHITIFAILKSYIRMHKRVGQRTVSILGGGQLGRMFIQEAINYNVNTRVLDPDPKAPCSSICDEFVNGNFKEYDEVMRFGKNADVITVEIEHVNVDALEELEKQGVKIYPQPSVLRVVQDKGVQKKFYRDHGIPTSEFALVEGSSDIESCGITLPAMQKLRTSGYDGRGVKAIRTEKDMEEAFDAPSLIEKMVDFEMEISVIISRNTSGEVASFPVVDMEFNPEANLVEFLLSPSGVSEEVKEKATSIAHKLITGLDMVGILAVEMFVTRSGEVLVNEMAPRPHNSGHQTIEGNITSQYAAHLRAILDLPPGDTSVLRPAVMVNLLGEKGHNGNAVYEGMDEVMRIPGAYIHLYGKAVTKPFRKMGHVTVLADTAREAKEKAVRIQSLLKVVS
jgi:5-(carboxyamino)imidazole ribonucleotide synthase